MGKSPHSNKIILNSTLTTKPINIFNFESITINKYIYFRMLRDAVIPFYVFPSRLHHILQSIQIKLKRCVVFNQTLFFTAILLRYLYASNLNIYKTCSYIPKRIRLSNRTLSIFSTEGGA